jgi:hypothetical protein
MSAAFGRRSGGQGGVGVGAAANLGSAGTTAAGRGVIAGATAIAGTAATRPIAGSGGGSAGSGGASSDQIEAARQVCVDEINRYRAMVMVPALMRGTAAQETCSDTGAKKDGDSGVGHSSASDCASLKLPGQQDSCPGWPVGGRGGSATVADALKKCLAQMWAEGAPPQGRTACIQDRTGCFEKYGHYLNMSDPTPKVVACGFYEMKDGVSWWMNQNFGP